MKCPKCVEAGMPGVLHRAPGGISTALGSGTYYDEDGHFHRHDPNWSMQDYWCEHGHGFAVSARSKCPSCDYGSEPDEVVFCEPPPLPESGS